MNGIDELITRFTAAQYGLVARWQALAVGVPAAAFDHRIAKEMLVLVHPAVYRLRGVPYTQELRWLAGVLAAGPEAWLSHRAGASLQGFDLRFPKPEITIAHRRECHLDGVIAHRTRRAHDVVMVRGIPVTSKPRTLLDCATVLPFPVFERLLQNAVTSGVVKIEAILAIVDRRGGRGVDGTNDTRRALAGGLVDDKIQRELELLLARIIASADVPAPVRQHPLTCADGREVVLDNAWPDRKIAVEGVGLRWHGNAGQARKTRARSRSITASGWDHYEYGWSEAVEEADDIRRLLESFWAGSAGHGPADPAQNEDAAA
ncbi:MAG TPA: hypothetical protein VM262_18265 [Acidimicrobiales bacterium]|nr:hypothetical protein [Acidimicrobiales bacterium]